MKFMSIKIWYYRKIMDIYNIPIDFIWKYREFDRCGEDNLYGDEYIKNLTEDIINNGIQEPIILQVDCGLGLLTEGNHRLCIAKNLGFKTIDVKVIRRSFGSINKSKAKPINFISNKWEIGLWD